MSISMSVSISRSISASTFISICISISADIISISMCISISISVSIYALSKCPFLLSSSKVSEHRRRPPSWLHQGAVSEKELLCGATSGF